MLWIIGSLLTLVALILAAYAIGASLPREHTATVRARFAASPESVWGLLADVAGSKAWRSDLKGVEILPDKDGKMAWLEQTKFGPIPYVMDEFDPPRRMVRRIAGDSLPFGGRWEFTLIPAGEGCELSITEYGLIRPPLFRFMGRYLFGYTRTLEQFEKELGEKLGERTSPRHVASPKDLM